MTWKFLDLPCVIRQRLKKVTPAFFAFFQITYLHNCPENNKWFLSGLQAISGDSHEHDEDLSAIFKGLTALGGIYFFFMAEKLVALVSEIRAEEKAEAVSWLEVWNLNFEIWIYEVCNLNFDISLSKFEFSKYEVCNLNFWIWILRIECLKFYF